MALVVGTLLALINHTDALLAGALNTALLAKILLTYLVPFSVASWSAVQTELAKQSL